jgi:hypothetical protein
LESAREFFDMNTATLTVLIILLVIIAAGVVLLVARQAQRRRSERLRERFGPEYDRAVEHADDRRAAESELAAREKRHRSFELRDLDPGQRREFEQRWADVQREFVDGPARAVTEADRLVVEVMKARGYPVAEFDQRADDLSVRYPEVTARYREARGIARANERGEASTEDLRGALTSYRALVEALMGDERGEGRRESEAGRESAGTGSEGRERELADQGGNGSAGRESAGHAATTGKANGQEGGA